MAYRQQLPRISQDRVPAGYRASSPSVRVPVADRVNDDKNQPPGRDQWRWRQEKCLLLAGSGY